MIQSLLLNFKLQEGIHPSSELAKFFPNLVQQPNLSPSAATSSPNGMYPPHNTPTPALGDLNAGPPPQVQPFSLNTFLAQSKQGPPTVYPPPYNPSAPAPLHVSPPPNVFHTPYNPPTIPQAISTSVRPFASSPALPTATSASHSQPQPQSSSPSLLSTHSTVVDNKGKTPKKDKYTSLLFQFLLLTPMKAAWNALNREANCV